MNKFKIFFSIMFIFIFTLTPISILAEQESQSIAVTPIEKEMDDITKRFILAAFGKQALAWFAVDSELDYLLEIEDEEIKDFSRPFNKNNFSMIKSYIIISLIIGFSLFSVYLFWIVKEGIIRSQNSGQFLGQNWSTLFTVTKIGIVTILLFPIYSPYNVGHMLIFKTLGYSNIIAKEINNTIISHQPKTYPTVKFPASGAKKMASESIIAFMTCVKAEQVNGSIELNFTKEEGKISAKSNFGNCHIDYEIGFDEGTAYTISQNKKLKEALDITIDYDAIQITILKDLVEETLKLADKSSDVLLIPFRSDINEKEKSIAFKKYTAEHASNPSYIYHWEGYCDEIFNFKSLNPSVKELNKNEKEQYLYLASRCMSYEVVKKLVYPTEINDFSKYLKTKNYLKENHIELCSHEYSGIEGLKVRAIIKESDITGAETLTRLEETVRTNVNIKTKSIKECLREQCSNLTGEFSNAYMCANVINLYDQINKNNRMSETGFLTLGAYMYNLFGSGKINEDAKKIFNGFKVSYAENEISSDSKTDTTLFTINYEFNKPDVDNIVKAGTRSIVSSTVIPSYKSQFDKKETQEEGVANLFNFAEGGEIDLLGSKRFTTCMKNSLKIENGYSCGSVPEEMNNFGKNLFEYAVYTKTMLAVYQSIFSTMDILKRNTKKTAGVKGNKDNGNENNTSKNNKTNKKKSKLGASKILISTLAMIPGANNEISQVIQNFSIDIIGKELTETDDFGNLTTIKIENQLMDITNQSANGIAIFAAWGADNFIGKLINMLINGIMFIGFVFAYVIPLIPLYLWMMVIIGWFMLLFETIAILPIWIPTLASPTENNSSEAERKGFAIILKLFLKAPLLCMGLLTAWIITNSVISRIMSYLDFEKIFSVEYGYSLTTAIDSMVLMVAYVVFLWYIINITITIIEAFYEFATNWLTGSPSMRTYGKDVTSGFLQKGSAQRSTMGMLNPMGKGKRK